MVVSIRDKKAILSYNEIALRLGFDITPLIDLSDLSYNEKVKIYAKDESQNATGSIKVRAALFNLVRAIAEGEKWGARSHFLDASSGNYAKALFYVTSQLGYESTLFVPESVSCELQEYISQKSKKRSDAKLFYKGIKNSDDARERVQQYSHEHPELTFLDQYNNEGSWLCHYHFTAQEILSQLNEKRLRPTHFISGIGSGGTLIGIGKRFKEFDCVEIIGLESKIPHSIRGIRCLDQRTVPEVYSASSHLVDRVESVDPEKITLFRASHAFNFGVSAYANMYASIQLSQQVEKGVIVTVLPDGGMA